MLVGIVLIVLSYLLGWPLIGVLGGVALHLGKPLIFSIGSPTAYVFSYVVLFAGLYLAGMQRLAPFEALVRRLGRTGVKGERREHHHAEHTCMETSRDPEE